MQSLETWSERFLAPRGGLCQHHSGSCDGDLREKGPTSLENLGAHCPQTTRHNGPSGDEKIDPSFPSIPTSMLTETFLTENSCITQGKKTTQERVHLHVTCIVT